MVKGAEDTEDQDGYALDQYHPKQPFPEDGARTSSESISRAPSDESEAEGLLQDVVLNLGVGALSGENNELRPRHLAALYTSHALSMWNNRSYEFAAVLFTASAFPNTLVVIAIRGMAGHLVSLIFSPSVGTWCDRQPSRLRSLLVCIIAQRICITLACLGWILIVQNKAPDQTDDPQDSRTIPLKVVMLLLLIWLGMVEKLSQVGNLITMERDWIPLIAAPSSDVQSQQTIGKKSLLSATLDLIQGNRPLELHLLNATMKRIDLISKLVAPLVISGITLALNSVRAAAVTIAITQIVSIGPELYLAWLVWLASPSLQSLKQPFTGNPQSGRFGARPANQTHFLQRGLSLAIDHLSEWTRGLRMYFSSPTCLPSLSYAMEPFSVLTMASSMTVYLLAAHLPLGLITAARATSTGVELISTIATPILISWLSSRQSASQLIKGQPKALVQVGLWGLFWQLGFLIPATTILFLLPTTAIDAHATSPVLEILLFATLALSRFGPFAYALVEQQLVQVTVPSQERLQFSGIEMAFIDLAELFRWGMLGIFGHPDQFRFVALVSFITVGISTGLFWVWTRRAANQPT